MKEGSKAAEKAWLKLCGERGKGWQGMKGGIMAEVEGVEALISRLDEVYKGLSSVEEDGVDVENAKALEEVKTEKEIKTEVVKEGKSGKIKEKEKEKEKQIVEID